MFKKYYPSAYVPDVFNIDYKRLYVKGYRGIIFDIDGTLVPHGGDSTPEVDALFRRIHEAGLKTILLTNNDEARVLRFIRNIDTLYLCDAEKPDVEGYLKAVEMLGIPKEQAIYIGDQMFIDIVGANHAGIDSILVHYKLHEGETKLGIKRTLEKPLMLLYRGNRRCYNRIGDLSKED